MTERIIRVFPRQTRATPTDALAYSGRPGKEALPDMFCEADRVEISVPFTWQLELADWLAEQWRPVAPVEIGGPAVGRPSGDFQPGRYLRPGYVITSRGCPNRCPHCRAGTGRPPRELPIVDGHIVQDDNLLACSENHIRAVFEMLRRQRREVKFSGGLEACRFRDWHLDLLLSLRRQPTIFFAYDRPNQWEPLTWVVDKLRRAGVSFAGHRVRCYCLIGQPGDTLAAAESRLQQICRLGITPAAMLFRPYDRRGRPLLQDALRAWQALQRVYFRPALQAARIARLI